MTNFYRRNAAIKLVSVLLAVLLWIYVSNLQNPTRDRFIPNVPLEQRGARGDLAILSIPSTVGVRVQGSSTAMNSFASKDAKAYVNLEGVGPGINWLEVKVVVPPGLQVLSLQPERVKVEMAAMGQRQIPIHVDYQGEAALGYSPGKPVLKPGVVVVRGTEEKLARVASAFVVIDLKGNKTDLSEYLPLQLVDEKGRSIDSRYVQYEPKVIDVRIPIIKEQPLKDIPVKPQLLGEPAAGYQLDTVTAIPDKVTVQGAEKALQTVLQAATEKIDVNGKSQDFTAEVDLLPIPGVNLLQKGKIKVQVKLKPVPEKIPDQVYSQER